MKNRKHASGEEQETEQVEVTNPHSTTLCRNCNEWTDDQYGICADCREEGYYNSMLEKNDPEVVVETRELSYAERTRASLLIELRGIYDRYQTADSGGMELEDRVKVEAIEEELQEREDHESKIHERW